MDLLVARNPDPDSSLPFLLWVPVDGGLVFRAKDTWPRTSAVFCFPVARTEWPAEPELVEQVPLRSCRRRGAAIDVVADRGREQRSQIVFTKGRGRDMVFWQAPRTRKQARPNVTVPTARAAGLAEIQVMFPAVPIVFCETRKLAEEWTYRYLAAALSHARDDRAMPDRVVD